MSVIKKMRRQRAVLWRLAGTDHYGKPYFYGPEEIACRWDDGSEEMRDAQGQSFTFTSTVYPDQALQIGDMLKLGEMDSETTSDPVAEGAKAIQRVVANPNFRATETLHTVYL